MRSEISKVQEQVHESELSLTWSLFLLFEIRFLSARGAISADVEDRLDIIGLRHFLVLSFVINYNNYRLIIIR